MSRLAGSPNVGAARQAASLASRTPPPARPGTACVRCGGLLVHSYTAALERDVSGRPVTLWRCVNCGDCVDPFILANRWKGPASAISHVRLPAGPPRAGLAGGMLR